MSRITEWLSSPRATRPLYVSAGVIAFVLVVLTFAYVTRLPGPVAAVREGNEADRCTRRFSGAVVDARTTLQDWQAEEVRLIGLMVIGNARAATADQKFTGAAARERLPQIVSDDGEIVKAQEELQRRNDRYKVLLEAEENHPNRFRKMCAEGP